VIRVLLGLALLLLGGGAGIAVYAIGVVEQKLTDKGFHWAEQSIRLPSLAWSGIEGPGMNASLLLVQPSWPVQVQLLDAKIDPSTLPADASNTASNASGTTSTNSIDIPFEVHARNLSVSWKEHSLVSGMNGSLFPIISLSNEANSIEAAWDPAKPRHIHGTANTRLEHEYATAEVSAEFNLGAFIELELKSSNLVVRHKFLAGQPMPEIPFKTRLVWKADTREIAAEGEIGEVAWNAIGTTDTKTHDMLIRIPMTPLSSIVSLFGGLIPESEAAEIVGEVGLAAHIAGPPWEWSFEPAAQDLSVSGALPDQFGGDRVRWRRNGVPFETGPASTGWVNLDNAGWLPEAAIAAEDIRFRTHPGFDLVAIQEALDASMNEERMRGGSTITQQLCKNLFLDGRRTLLRKLRELVLAMNMENRMSKDAILALYLNVVEFGPGINGIAEASHAWFLKDPAHLSPREAAFLVSILPAPNMWHKRISKTKEVPIRRVNEVLNRMRIRGTLSVGEHRRAIQERLRVVPP